MNIFQENEKKATAPFSPWRNLCKIGPSVEEIKDNNRHNDGDCGHGHHEGQVDSCK